MSLLQPPPKPEPPRQRLDQKELAELRPLLEMAVKAAIESFLRKPVHQRVLSHIINYTDLIPTGDLFDLHLRVEIHEKETPNDLKGEAKTP